MHAHACACVRVCVLFLCEAGKVSSLSGVLLKRIPPPSQWDVEGVEGWRQGEQMKGSGAAETSLIRSLAPECPSLAPSFW